MDDDLPSAGGRPLPLRILRPGDDTAPTEAVVALGLGVCLLVALIIGAFTAGWLWVPFLLVALGLVAVPMCLGAKRRLDRVE